MMNTIRSDNGQVAQLAQTAAHPGTTGASGNGREDNAGVTVRVAQQPGEGAICGSDHRALQAAVDYVARLGGGTV
ncbi:MAG: hypothetical protein ACRDI2_16930, partial [Chloroflexota bacterium]